ncbi:MAG: 2-oxo acid dehydrogenase subunit E2 [Enterobacteriaceae bacterium]
MRRTIKMPDIGNLKMEVTEILVEIEDEIKKNDHIISVEGEKTSLEITSPYNGYVKNILINIGDFVITDTKLIKLEEKKNKEKVYKSPLKKDEIDIHTTPSVRRIARDYNIDLSKVKGSGRLNRITCNDLQNHINKIEKNNKKEEYKSNSKDLTKIEIFSGNHLYQSWSKVPHVTQFEEADITNLEDFRKNKNLEIEKKNENYKITILSFIVKVVSNALTIFPKFNSFLSEDNKKIIFNNFINIKIAINTEYGLFTPTINSPNKKSISEISKIIIDLSKKAHSNTLNLSDINKGSFTISNLGSFGAGIFTPIVNYPEISILGVSSSYIKPVWNGKKFFPKLYLPMSLSYNHRVINGVEAVNFIKYIKKNLEDVREIIM